MLQKASKWQGQNVTQDGVTPRVGGPFPGACYYHDPNFTAEAHVSSAHYSLPILADIKILDFKKPKHLGKSEVLYKHCSGAIHVHTLHLCVGTSYQPVSLKC